jgi:hypothetical protein
MSDKVLERFSMSRKADSHLAGVIGQEESDSHDLGCFGVLRGASERSVMLELRKRDGNITAIGYAWLERIEFDPSEGIRLFAAGQEFTVAGRNLNKEVRPNLRLFEALTRHRVPWLREAENADGMVTPESATVIESISWKGAKR